MESGTLLHIALLRRTSNAKKRQKSLMQKKRKFQQISLNEQHVQQHFTISGWCTEENQLRIQLDQNKTKKLNKLRKSFDQQKLNSQSQRVNVKTSQCIQRPKNRALSYRNYNGHSLSTNDNKLKTDHDHRLKQFNSQANIQPQKKLSKLNILYQKGGSNVAHKQNQSSSQIQFPKPTKDQILNKIIWKKEDGKQLGNRQGNPHSFTNFINLNNIRARKFFKL